MTPEGSHTKPILVTGAAGAVGSIGRNLTEIRWPAALQSNAQNKGMDRPVFERLPSAPAPRPWRTCSGGVPPAGNARLDYLLKIRLRYSTTLSKTIANVSLNFAF